MKRLLSQAAQFAQQPQHLWSKTGISESFRIKAAIYVVFMFLAVVPNFGISWCVGGSIMLGVKVKVEGHCNCAMGIAKDRFPQNNCFMNVKGLYYVL